MRNNNIFQHLFFPFFFLSKAFVEHSNDIHLVIYVSSIVRAIVALHTLVQNKAKFGKDGEVKKVVKKVEEKKEKEPEKDKFGRVVKKKEP